MIGRNINSEMKKYDVRYLNPKQMTPEKKKKLFWSKFKKMQYPFVRCKSCGKRIYNDNNLIQRHFMIEHQASTQTNKQEVGFDIAPTWTNIRSVI